MADDLRPFQTRLSGRTTLAIRYIALREDSSSAEVARQALDAHVDRWTDPITHQAIPEHVLAILTERPTL